MIVLVLCVAGLGYLAHARNKVVMAKELSAKNAAANELRQANIRAVRNVDQFLKAGYLSPTCAGTHLAPAPTAPVAATSSFDAATKSYRMSACRTKTLTGADTTALFATNGVEPGGCNRINSKVSFTSVDLANRKAEVVAEATVVQRGKPVVEQTKAELTFPDVTPRFAILLDDVECSVCHWRFTGDVVSTAPISIVGGDQLALQGDWMTAQSWSKNAGITVSFDPGFAVKSPYSGLEMPRDVTGDGKPDFPTIDWATIGPKMSGKVRSFVSLNIMGSMIAPQTVTNVYTGNLVLEGTTAKPISVDGEVYVTGDLVIRGVYKGIGTIYVGGNIYIPFNLMPQTSAFPYDPSRQVAQKQAIALLPDKADALALAARGSIMIGDLGSGTFTFAYPNNPPGKVWAPAQCTGAPSPSTPATFCRLDDDIVDDPENCVPDHPDHCQSIYDHPFAPAAAKRGAMNVNRVYTWFPRGIPGYKRMYGNGRDCRTNAPTRPGSFDLVEAMLYSANAVGGVSRMNTPAIKGTVIARMFHVIAGGGMPECQSSPYASTLHPVNGMKRDKATVVFDWRLLFGLPVLKQLRPALQPPICL